MFSKFQDQFKKSSAPANTLFAANAKLIEKMSEQQTELFSGVINDSLKLMDSCAEQSELKGLVAAQSMFAQAFRDRITSASKTTYATLNDMGQEYTSVMKQTFETASEVTKEVAEQAAKSTQVTTAPAVAKKAAPKKVPSKAVAKSKVAAKKAPAKEASKPVASKVATKQTEVKKTEAKAEAKTPAKPVSKPAVKAAAKPAPKSASKPVAKLSADEVKASN